MYFLSKYLGIGLVALLAEGVDRNFESFTDSLKKHVALLAEGVDRNMNRTTRCMPVYSRPPRGGRG